MIPTHNEDEVEEILPLDEMTGSNRSSEMAIVNTTVTISDEEVMNILNYALNRHKNDQRQNA
jgi:hypothetical protein